MSKRKDEDPSWGESLWFAVKCSALILAILLMMELWKVLPVDPTRTVGGRW